MARTSATRARRSRYTPEQRAERAEADARLLDAAAAAMADPDLITRRMRQAVTGMSARILSYSLRNQMLLMEQAEQRGVALHDVDTFKGWQARGRQVRKGERGLRIVRPVGLDDDTDQDTDPGRDDNPDAQIRVRFRFMAVFDVSQTDEVEGSTGTDDHGGACPTCDAEPGVPCRPGCTCAGCTGELDKLTATQEPAEVAWNRLQEQITQAGYRFDWPATVEALAGAQVRTDHNARTVHVGMFADAADPDSLATLAVALGEIITRAERDHAHRPPARRAIEPAPAA
jgi:hypothetical protein